VALPNIFYWTIGKDVFVERRTRQSPALGKKVVYRVQDTRYSEALGKDCFAESQTLGNDDSRQMTVSGRLQLTAVSLCRVLNSWHSVKRVFTECLPWTLGKEFFIFLFWPSNFLWYVPTLCRPTYTILGQL
jgi:hypothetical protein